MLSSRASSFLQLSAVHAGQQNWLYTTAWAAAALKKRVAFIEAPGGTDKQPDGHRKDTLPQVAAIKAHKGWGSGVEWYKDDPKTHDKLFKRLLTYDAAVSRVNPGNIDDYKYWAFLRKVGKHITLYEHPDVETSMGAKDALVDLAGKTDLVPDDTFGYKTVDQLKAKFPTVLSKGERVLKQNIGATGQGIWRVQLADKRTFKEDE
eukprot:418678_1